MTLTKTLATASIAKKKKDHSEGGSMVGYKLHDGDKVLIIEDVITAGTAIREIFPILKGATMLKLKALSFRRLYGKRSRQSNNYPIN